MTARASFSSANEASSENPRHLSDENKRLIEGFALWLSTRAEKTKAAYVRDVTSLAEAIDPMGLTALSRDKLARQLARWHGAGLSGRSLARMLSSTRAFFRYAMMNHHVTQNPCEHIKAPRSAKRLPTALAIEETAQLLDEKSKPDNALWVRDVAMFELLYSSGLRVSELTGLNIDNIDLDEKEARVLGKGSKERIVPIGNAARDAIIQWLAVRQQLLDGRKTDQAGAVTALFIGRYGTRLTPRSVEMRLAAHARTHGLAQHVHPHMLRHSFASHILQSSGDLRAVQELLGHASIKSTQVYTHLDFQALAKVYDKAHPRAKRK
ncbi:MAG: tyrosine-type recombinase/integrase [Burkholderiales bacterium]|jgi:integrase/recombinase XerC|nr:tyrosine-type recombinase/integrase [Burkholderiales bacterium]